MVCLKDDDEVVSKSIKSYGSWDRDSVTKVMMAMEMYEDAVFVGKITTPNHWIVYNCVFFIKTGAATLGCTP